MRKLRHIWLGAAISVGASGQQTVVFELPRPIWSIETGDIGPAGLPVRPSLASMVNGKDVIYSATEIGPQTIGVYASGRRMFGSGDTIPGVPNRIFWSAPILCNTDGPAPWMTINVLDSNGVPGSVVMQGGRVLFYPGQDPGVLGLPSIGSIFDTGFLSGATSELAYCGISVRRPNGTFDLTLHRVTTDGLGRIQTTQQVYEIGQSHPAFPVPITGLLGGGMSPSGRLIFVASASDNTTGAIYTSVLLDDVPVLSSGDLVPGSNAPLGSFRSTAANDNGDWAAVGLVNPSGSVVLIKNGTLLYDESVGTPLFGAPPIAEIRILGMTNDGRLFWRLGGHTSGGVPGVPIGQVFRAIFCDDELVATNAGSYLEGERVERLSIDNCLIDPDGRYLSITTRVVTAAGSLRERVAILPMDASTTYCENGATTAGFEPHLGIYGSSQLEHETGFQAIGRYLPPGRPVLMLASTDSASGSVLGTAQGELCLGGTILRSKLLVASALGDVSLDLNGFMPRPGSPPLMPGDELFFQAWYIDQDASGGSLQRVTECVGVQFN